MTEVVLRLTNSHWEKKQPQGHSNDDGSSEALYVRSDYPCVDPTSPSTLAHHPGRLCAVRVGVGEVTLAEDRLRSWPLFYAFEEPRAGKDARLIISDDATAMRDALTSPALLAPAMHELEHAGFVTGTRTLLAGVQQVQQGTVVHINRIDGTTSTDNYGYYQFSDQEVTDADTFSDMLSGALDQTFTRAIERAKGKLVVPLSGGLDSRLIVAWLAAHGYDDVLTFTYGLPGSKEATVSQTVAQAAGFQWEFVPYIRRELLKTWHSRETAEFLRYSYELSALPHVQDLHAIRTLRKQGILSENDIVLPGHTVVGNMHHIHLLDSEPVTRASIAEAIIRYHHDLQGTSRSELHNRWNIPPVKDALNTVDFDGTLRKTQTVVEGFNLRERQAKYINNSMRAYEFFDLDWALPMLDDEFWHTWARGSIELTAPRDFYTDFVNDKCSEAFGSSGSQIPLFVPSNASKSTRDKIKSVLKKLHLLDLIETTLSTRATMNSPMAFDALITNKSRFDIARELMRSKSILGFWTESFLNDTWCSQSDLFGDLPVVSE